VFTGNMTGNVVILGMGLVGQDDLPVAGPLVALCAYIVGAAIAGRFLASLESTWGPQTSAVFAASTVLLLAAAVILMRTPTASGSLLGVIVAGIIAVVMGAQAATARALAVTDMTTVVVTSTITAYASQTLFTSGYTRFTHRRLWAVVAIFGGAICGAVLMRVDVSLPVFVSAAAVVGVAVMGHSHWHAD
jgi:uncharacterized membrane protein YoaK (UPF0700 family)